MYKVEDKITISPNDLQNWYDNKVSPKGLEDFGALVDESFDVDSGEFDSGKSSMIDYKIWIVNEKTDKVWIGRGGYYNWGCGHKFNYDITFTKEVKQERKIFNGEFKYQDVYEEDGGMAQIIEFDDGEEEGMFVRVQSWDETLKHADFNKFVGKKVRITIETIK